MLYKLVKKEFEKMPDETFDELLVLVDQVVEGQITPEEYSTKVNALVDPEALERMGKVAALATGLVTQ